MHKKAKALYLAALGALVLFVILGAFAGMDAQTSPFLFETMSVLVFLPLSAALWLDYRRRAVRPVWLFFLAALISLFCAVHFFLLVRLLA